jgi:hypothetical protein
VVREGSPLVKLRNSALALAAPVLFFLMWAGLHWILAVVLFVAFALLILLKEGAGPAR